MKAKCTELCDIDDQSTALTTSLYSILFRPTSTASYAYQLGHVQRCSVKKKPQKDARCNTLTLKNSEPMLLITVDFSFLWCSAS